jgi:hypothetical protein
MPAPLLRGVGFGPLRYVSVEFGGSRVTQATQPFDFFQEFKCLWPKLVVPAQVCHSIR